MTTYKMMLGRTPLLKIRDVPIHRYRLISVSFSHIGIGLKKIEPL